MGVLSRKPKPAFSPPELPMFNGPNQRRGSVVDRIRNFSIASLNAGSDNFSFAGPSSEHMADPYLHHGTQQTSFLGRKFSSALVPASARKASLAVAERQRDPVGMRMGETDGIAEEEFKDTFYNARLVLDGGSDEEMDEKLGTVKLDKGKGRGDWTATLGWEAAPPIGVAKRWKDRESMKRKHREKRVMRRLDTDLDAFNAHAQNGLTPLTHSVDISRKASVTSLPSFLPVTTAPSILDTDSMYLPDDRPRAVLIGDGFDALDVMAHHIFRIGVQKKKWFKAPKLGQKREEVGTGVTLRVKTGLYRTFPVDYEALDEFEDAMKRLNPEAAIKIKSQIVGSIMKTYM
jgi:hypothetical protein